MATPLTLSAFTHLWNPIGFPAVYDDEETYIKRAILLLNGHGPKDPDYLYDHPYFGQIFLAAALKLIGYPDFLNPAGDVGSDANMEHLIQMLYLVPRVLMGILAVVDTFLIYKISEYRYNRQVAFIASILFAVMPISWLTRRIVLDSIQLPFLLASILFAVYYHNNTTKKNSSKTTTNNKNKMILTFLLSGIFLGLAIFTKIPAFTMIPLIGFLIYTNKSNKKRLKILGLWFIPVIMIPLIWPIYAVSIGEFNMWLQGAYNQSHRHEEFNFSINSFFKIDPVLLVLATAGLVFSAVIKKDFTFFVWVVPYLIFLYLIGSVISFHIILLLPPFCIAAAQLITSLSIRRIRKRHVQQTITKYFSSSDYSTGTSHRFAINRHSVDVFFRLFLSKLPFTIISIVGIFGLVSTIMLITINLNSSYFKVYAFIVKNVGSNGDENKISILGDDRYFWIPNYVFHKDYYYKEIGFEGLGIEPIRSRTVLLIVDEGSKVHFQREWKMIYDNTLPVAAFKRNMDAYNQLNLYPYTSLSENYFHKFRLFFPVTTEIRTNMLPLNSSASIVHLSDGQIIDDVNHKLEAVVPINQTQSLPSYWNDSFGNCKNDFKCLTNSTIGWKNDTRSFQVSTTSTKNDTWSWIYGKQIAVNSGEKYALITHMKLNRYATGSHIAIEGYSETSKRWNQLTQCPSGTDGPLEWHEFSCNITIPKDTTKIRPILNAGWSSQLGKEAVTLFDAIYLDKISSNDTNVIGNNLISNPNFIYFDKLQVTAIGLCQLKGDFDVQIHYLSSRHGDKLSLVAHCSKIYYG